MIAALLLLLLATPAKAEDWICRSQSSISRGSDVMLTCGIGDAESEVEAREMAYTEALNEFHRVCDVSADCKDQAIVVRPERTECSKSEEGVRCYRAVSFVIEAKAKDAETELDQKRREIASVKSKQAEAEELASAEADLKFSKPNPSYWSLGVGMHIGGTTFQGQSALQIGVGLNLKRCFSDVFCPVVGGTIGKILINQVYLGNYANGYAGAQVYVYKRLYAVGTAGFEYQQTTEGRAFGPTGTLGLGVEAVRVDSVSISLEAAAKVGPNAQVNGVGNVFFNFKF